MDITPTLVLPVQSGLAAHIPAVQKCRVIKKQQTTSNPLKTTIPPKSAAAAVAKDLTSKSNVLVKNRTLSKTNAAPILEPALGKARGTPSHPAPTEQRAVTPVETFKRPTDEEIWCVSTTR
jgi:hypothetical protein